MIFQNSLYNYSQLFKNALLVAATAGFFFPIASTTPSASASTTVNNTIAKKSSAERAVLEDGSYLFGQSPNANELGSTYAILSVQNNQVIGAFYQPHSSFDCFSGHIYPNLLDISVVNSYEQTAYPYEIAVTVDSTLIAGGGAGAYTLEGFHRLESLSEQDQNILTTCQTDLVQ